MPRRTKEVVITDEGRDKGKSFLLTEVGALQAEKWAIRAGLLAVQNGVDIRNPIDGMAGLVLAGVFTVLGGLKFSDLEPLLDEMLTCIQYRPDSRNPDIAKSMVVRQLFPDDIEEVQTLFRLRREVVELHLGFSIAAALSTLQEDSAATTDSSDIPTSPPPSARPSPRGRPLSTNSPLSMG